jgi:AbrB family looped-hinge helix DNA binding protein
MTMAASVKLSSKHQIVVPLEAREALGLRPGDRLLITVRADGVAELQREPLDVTKELEGLLKATEDGEELWPEARGE